MAPKQVPTRARPKPRENSPLLFLMLLITPLFGGYYNFITLLAGSVLALLLLHHLWRSGTASLYLEPKDWALGALCLATALALPFAVSWGMALAGVLRLLTWGLFALYAATYTQQERQGILDTLAYEGALLSLVTIVGYLYDLAVGAENANGRIDGLFQYANSWSLFLAACLLLLALRQERRRLDWPAMGLLLGGIFLSGSRGIFLLLGLLGLVLGVSHALRRRSLRPLLLGAGAVVLIGGAAALFSGGMVLDRLQAITLSSSSLNGRLLYNLDGLRMLWEHPMGVGRGGYLYLQPLYQTGVYTLRFLHNEYLQAALDGGILAGLAFAALMLLLLLRRGLPTRQRAVVLLIAAHCLLDFDLQFTAIVFLLLLCGSGERPAAVAITRRRAGRAGAAAAAAVLGGFALVYLLDFTGATGPAYALFPADLTLAENRLQHCADIGEAEPIANRILAQSQASLLAWDCKFAAAAERADLFGMVEAKYQYLRLTPYMQSSYADFTSLLEEAWIHGSPEELDEYRRLAEAAANQLEEVNQRTSPLAYRMVDQPELDFSQDMHARLQQMK